MDIDQFLNETHSSVENLQTPEQGSTDIVVLNPEERALVNRGFRKSPRLFARDPGGRSDAHYGSRTPFRIDFALSFDARAGLYFRSRAVAGDAHRHALHDRRRRAASDAADQGNSRTGLPCREVPRVFGHHEGGDQFAFRGFRRAGAQAGHAQHHVHSDGRKTCTCRFWTIPTSIPMSGAI